MVSCKLALAKAPFLFYLQADPVPMEPQCRQHFRVRGLWSFGQLGPSDKPHQIPVVLPAITDNRGNEFLKKGSTTKLPLMLINMQLSHLLRIACLRLNLNWKRRSEHFAACVRRADGLR